MSNSMIGEKTDCSEWDKLRQPLFFISSQIVYYELSQRLSIIKRRETKLSEERVTSEGHI